MNNPSLTFRPLDVSLPLRKIRELRTAAHFSPINHCQSEICVQMPTYRNNWRFFRIITWLFLGAGGLGLLLASGAAASGTPRISLTETAHDFGKVYEDASLTYTFMIRNTGGSPLEIQDVDPDCACTVASYDRLIPPGGEGKVTLSIKPYSVLRQFKKETTVRVNDPERPEVVLTLQGVAQPFIEIQPSHIIRLRGIVNDEVRGQVRFISHLPSPWQITEYRTNIPDNIEVNLKAVEPGRVYVLEVRNKRHEAGHYAGLVELLTTSTQRPRLIVRVFGDLYAPATVPQ